MSASWISQGWYYKSTVWMVNSTAQGGGVAEMLPKVVTLLRASGDPHISHDDRDLYAAASRRLADAFRDHIGPNDVLIVHDPQPAGVGAFLADEFDVPAIWRCHIGLDEETPPPSPTTSDCSFAPS